VTTPAPGPRPAGTLAILAACCAAMGWSAFVTGGPAHAGPPSRFVAAAAADSTPFSEPAPFLFPDQPPPDTTERALAARAREYFLTARTVEDTETGPALAAYQNVLRIDPLYPEANYRLGLLLLRSNLYREAAVYFAAELVRDSTHVGASRELGLALARAGDQEHALERLAKLSRERPDDDETWRALGYAYKQAGYADSAEAAYRKAIALPPPRAEEHRDFAVLLSGIGRDDDARREFDRATKMNPRDPIAWYNLGNLERRRARLREALDAYRRAEAADSTFAVAVQGQITVLQTMGRDYEAAQVYARWLETNPNDHNARDHAIQLLIRSGRPDLAVETAREGVRRNRKSLEARVLLARTLAETGARDEALKVLADAGPLARTPQEQAQLQALADTLGATRPPADTPGGR